MSAGKWELNSLKALIRERKPSFVDEVATLVTGYFNTVQWSLLKKEWDKMTKPERTALIQKLFDER